MEIDTNETDTFTVVALHVDTNTVDLKLNKNGGGKVVTGMDCSRLFLINRYDIALRCIMIYIFSPCDTYIWCLSR